MLSLTLNEIINYTKGKAFLHAKEINEKELLEKTLINDISLDSRKIEEGTLFIAIKGEKFDSHDFLEDVSKSGAVAAIVHKKAVVDNEKLAKFPLILVEDTNQAYLDIAGGYREKFNIPVVGVTGSVGKTTTKEMIWTVLSSQYKTLKNMGNFNNHIGVPRTLLNLDNSYEAAIIEMGMNHFGEIDMLAHAAKPTAVVVTNIGVSHIENLGSRANILKAKLEMLNWAAKDAPIFLCGDNDILSNLTSKDVGDRKIVFFGIENENNDYRATDVINNEDSTQFTIACKNSNEHESFVIPTVGKHNVLNAVCAYAIGQYFGISKEKCKDSLWTYSPEGMRQRIKIFNGIKVIEDCYNASPDSVKAAFSAISDMPKNGKKIVVLGDMLELGEKSPEMHFACGQLASKYDIDMILGYGSLAVEYVRGATQNGVEAIHMADKADLANYLYNKLKKGDTVLFKASRGMKLEEVMNSLYKMWEQSEQSVERVEI